MAFDFDARYKREGWDGVAWYCTGYAPKVTEVEDSFIDEGGETCYIYDVVIDDDPERVIAVMVGDDIEWHVEIDELTVISDDDYCSGCGQIGCGWGH